ncbi:hypothetical protein N9P88_00710 [Planctomycetota bacterium]|nr:hypothetical protein [Planctomycetota bacterium]
MKKTGIQSHDVDPFLEMGQILQKRSRAFPEWQWLYSATVNDWAPSSAAAFQRRLLQQ